MVGGVLGMLAAVATGFIGTIGGSFMDDPRTEELFGFFAIVGTVASLVIIITGSVGLKVRGVIPGIVAIVLSTIGAVAGGTLVAAALLLSLVGGILLILGRNEGRNDDTT